MGVPKMGTVGMSQKAINRTIKNLLTQPHSHTCQGNLSLPLPKLPKM
jgi:hypothetical protein